MAATRWQHLYLFVSAPLFTSVRFGAPQLTSPIAYHVTDGDCYRLLWQSSPDTHTESHTHMASGKNALDELTVALDPLPSAFSTSPTLSGQPSSPSVCHGFGLEPQRGPLSTSSRGHGGFSFAYPNVALDFGSVVI